jgi:hypothetical protein
MNYHGLSSALVAFLVELTCSAVRVNQSRYNRQGRGKQTQRATMKESKRTDPETTNNTNATSQAQKTKAQLTCRRSTEHESELPAVQRKDMLLPAAHVSCHDQPY